MKKSTLLKLVFIVAAALSLYGEAAKSPIPTACPSICIHILCADGEHAFCRNGKCVCP